MAGRVFVTTKNKHYHILLNMLGGAGGSIATITQPEICSALEDIGLLVTTQKHKTTIFDPVSATTTIVAPLYPRNTKGYYRNIASQIQRGLPEFHHNSIR